MTRATFDPSAWAFMSVEVKTTAPGGFALALSPKLPELVPLHAEGWQVHDHLYMGNGYVRVTLRRGRDWKPTPATAPVMDWAPLEAAKAAREDEVSEDPRHVYVDRATLEDTRLTNRHFQSDGRATTAVVHYVNGALTEEQIAAYHRAAGQRDADSDPRGTYISRKAEEAHHAR